jgi:hypothetical protein
MRLRRIPCDERYRTASLSNDAMGIGVYLSTRQPHQVQVERQKAGPKIFVASGVNDAVSTGLMASPRLVQWLKAFHAKGCG